jgi:hypothetical protein
MAVRWVAGLVAGFVLVLGLVFQVLALTVAGLVGLLGVVVLRPGRSPLAETYRDLRPTDREQDW